MLCVPVSEQTFHNTHTPADSSIMVLVCDRSLSFVTVDITILVGKMKRVMVIPRRMYAARAFFRHIFSCCERFDSRHCLLSFDSILINVALKRAYQILYVLFTVAQLNNNKLC